MGKRLLWTTRHSEKYFYSEPRYSNESQTNPAKAILLLLALSAFFSMRDSSSALIASVCAIQVFVPFALTASGTGGYEKLKY